jgi:hypothetical protein
MTVAMVLLVSALVGVLAGFAYHSLQSVAGKERFAARLAHWQARFRVPHIVVELAFVAISLPLTIAPFVIVMVVPLRIDAAVLPASPLVIIAAPITSLLALGVTSRVLRKRSREVRSSYDPGRVA